MLERLNSSLRVLVISGFLRVQSAFKATTLFSSKYFLSSIAFCPENTLFSFALQVSQLSAVKST